MQKSHKKDQRVLLVSDRLGKRAWDLWFLGENGGSHGAKAEYDGGGGEGHWRLLGTPKSMLMLFLAAM